MCGPSSKIPGPSQDELDAREASRRRSAEALKEERRTAEQLKAEQAEVSMALASGKRGRRSLLTGTKKGGSGFDVADSYQTKKTLGA
jgi:hypothetical protein